MGLGESAVIEDGRLREIDPGSFDGGLWKDYHNHIQSVESDWFHRATEDGESHKDVKVRTAKVLYELEEKCQNKNIILVTHGAPAWLLFINTGLFEPNHQEYSVARQEFNALQTAEVRELPFIPIPHNENFELDFHRPYIDNIKLVCACGSQMNRVPEVLDSWFESGSMPFAQDHFPFENSNWQKNNFPAGFVAEYIAQTRTWFYYSHVLSVILFGQAPFENVVTTGTLLAEDGQKISKSKKNYPDPWIFIDKYGVDALRIYLMTSPLMKGEDTNFSEKSVQEISSKIIGRLGNVVSFYELYPVPEQARDGASRDVLKSQNVLDQWILGRLNQLITETTSGMEAYDMNEASRPLENFIEDLSLWYLRRSRERIKDGDINARATLCFVLQTVAKVIAPFAPFIAEDIWLRLKDETDPESVHLAAWPEAPKSLLDIFSNRKSKILENMEQVRTIVSLGLEARQKASIKVRQPLSSIKVKVQSIKSSGEYIDLVRDELNVREVVFDSSIEQDVLLNINISEELKQEGDYRELVRALQDMRKEMGLTPSDIVSVSVETSDAGKSLIQKFESDMKKTVLISNVDFAQNDGTEIKINELVFKIKINK